jgi:hypothetical protein
MRTSRAFVLGAIMGAAVVWLWGQEMGPRPGAGAREPAVRGETS